MSRSGCRRDQRKKTKRGGTTAKQRSFVCKFLCPRNKANTVRLKVRRYRPADWMQATFLMSIAGYGGNYSWNWGRFGGGWRGSVGELSLGSRWGYSGFGQLAKARSLSGGLEVRSGGKSAALGRDDGVFRVGGRRIFAAAKMAHRSSPQRASSSGIRISDDKSVATIGHPAVAGWDQP